ncbi:MAG: hypothetical protein ACRCZZ_09705, partial [Phocaeicola sp.]
MLAFTELQSLNDSGTFRFKHPLIKNRSERALLEKLLKNDSKEFLRQHRNVIENINRYERSLRNTDCPIRKKKDKALIKKHRER